MARTQAERIANKRNQWIQRTALLLHVSEETAERVLSVKRQQSIRLNPLIADPNSSLSTLKALGWQGQPVEWCVNGFTTNSGLEEVKKSSLVSDGSVYVQNAASWLPVLALDPMPGEIILDMCAAPGGKTSHIAAMANDSARITANDNSKPRLVKLQKNLDTLGVKNVDYMLYDATKLSQKVPDTYDAILLDAPCSGEGMMNIEDSRSFETWSVAHIKRLQQLQKRLIVEAWKLLKPGGRLIYSTCTMAPEENEAVIDYLLRHNDNATIEACKLDLLNQVPSVLEWNGKKYDERLQFATRLIPSHDVEAFFVCKLTKNV